jgi:HSCB C-terminal oligomerisation domain
LIHLSLDPFQVEDAKSKDELQDLLSIVREEMSKVSDDFASLFQSGNLEFARARLVKMKYLASIENSIKEKLLR